MRRITAPLLVLLLSTAYCWAGTIEAEDYSEGGEGIAYHDTTPGNQGNAGIREDEDVDLWTPTDGTLIRIGSTREGEWVTWSYEFPTVGHYKFTFKVGTPNDDTTFAFVVTGNRYVVNVPNTGSYATDGTAELVAYVNASGRKAMKLTFLDNSFDIDKIHVELAGDLSGLGQQVKHDYVTYSAYTSKRFKVAWDQVENAEYYRTRIFNMEKDTYVAQGRTNNTEIVFSFPYGGHFVPQVAACRITEDDPEECSIWSSSNDSTYATVDGEPRAWWLYGFVEPPGQPSIED